MYMANVTPNARGPNETMFYLLALGLLWVHGDSRWVRKAFFYFRVTLWLNIGFTLRWEYFK